MVHVIDRTTWTTGLHSEIGSELNDLDSNDLISFGFALRSWSSLYDTFWLAVCDKRRRRPLQLVVTVDGLSRCHVADHCRYDAVRLCATVSVRRRPDALLTQLSSLQVRQRRSVCGRAESIGVDRVATAAGCFAGRRTVSCDAGCYLTAVTFVHSRQRLKHVNRSDTSSILKCFRRDYGFFILI